MFNPLFPWDESHHRVLTLADSQLARFKGFATARLIVDSFYTIPGFAEGYLLLKPMVNPPRGESIGCRFDFFGAILSESKYCWQDQSLPHVHTPMQAGATSCHMPIFVAQRVIFAWSPLSQSWCSAPRTTLQAPKTCVWKIMKTNEVISSPNTKCTRIQPLV